MQTQSAVLEISNSGRTEPQLANEASLWQQRDANPRAREELTSRYLPLARSLAARYRSANESFDDLLQVASVGLVNAINRFDASQSTPFAAFASPTILGELKRYFRDRVWMVRLPRSLQENIKTVETAITDLGASLRRNPTNDEIADHAGLDEVQVDEAFLAKLGRMPISLDQPLDADGHSAEDRVGSEDPNYLQVEDKEEIREAVSGLSPVERSVLRLRFIEDMTQSEIAQHIGYSQMHVSRLLRSSIERLEASASST